MQHIRSSAFLALLAASTATVPGLAAPATGTPAPQAGDTEVIGRAGTQDVSTADLQAYLALLPDADRERLAKNPAQLAQTVRGYLADRVVLTEAIGSHFDQKPEIKARLDQARNSLLTELYLQAETKIPDTYPTEAEVRALYDANKTALVAPRRFLLAQIFIAAPKDGKDEKAKEAQARTTQHVDEVMKKLKTKGADFAAIAKDMSDAKAEAAKGGEIGWFAEPQIVPEIRQALTGLEKGAVTAPVRLSDGWHILRLVDMKPAGTEPLPFAEAKAPLVAEMRRQKQAAERQAYITKLLQEKPPVINELVLSKLAPVLK